MELKENDHCMVFSYNSFVKFHGKEFGSHNMTVVYPNMYCYRVCYKGIVLYSMELLCTI